VECIGDYRAGRTTVNSFFAVEGDGCGKTSGRCSGSPRSRALPGNALSCRLCLLFSSVAVGRSVASCDPARQSLASRAFPGRAWERGGRGEQKGDTPSGNVYETRHPAPAGFTRFRWWRPVPSGRAGRAQRGRTDSGVRPAGRKRTGLHHQSSVNRAETRHPAPAGFTRLRWWRPVPSGRAGRAPLTVPQARLPPHYFPRHGGPRQTIC